MTSWPSCPSSPGPTTGTCAGTPRCLPCRLARHCSLPLLPSVCLSGLSRLGRVPCRGRSCPTTPWLTSADFSSPPPGLPEQAACVRGWEGLGGGTVTLLILASVEAFRAGSGMEPGMAELAARTLWIFISGLYLGLETKAQKDGMT